MTKSELQFIADFNAEYLEAPVQEVSEERFHLIGDYQSIGYSLEDAIEAADITLSI